MNYYILTKKEKRKNRLRRAINGFFRFWLVLSAIGLMAVWAGAEWGEIMLGRRLLISALLVVMMMAAVAGDVATRKENDT